MPFAQARILFTALNADCKDAACYILLLVVVVDLYELIVYVRFVTMETRWWDVKEEVLTKKETGKLTALILLTFPLSLTLFYFHCRHTLEQLQELSDAVFMKMVGLFI